VQSLWATVECFEGEAMTIAHHEPECPQLLDMQKLRFDQLWRQKKVGDATYCRSLFILGYLPDEARTELNLLKLENEWKDRGF
jgi:hypothetical protein